MPDTTPSAGAAPLVSVIIPTYNRRHLVGRAIESAFAQTYRPIEVVVIDDGSNDGTADFLASLPYPIVSLHQPNQGLAAARNAAIRHSRGSLIALLDSDDWWREDKLETCVAYLAQRPEVDVVYTPMLTVDAEGRPLHGHDVKRCYDGYILNEVFENSFVHDPAAVFHRSVWEKVGGFDERLPVCVGHSFWLRVAVEHRFGFIPEPLAIRTWLQDSLTRGKRVRAHRAKISFMEEFYQSGRGREKLDPQRARRALARTFYSAGKICARGGELRSGVEYLRRALAYRPQWSKAWLYYLWFSCRSFVSTRSLTS